MITLLARWLIPDRENTADPAVRRAYGTLCGAVGIALNLLLAAGKFIAGALAGSIAVTADAFNNLSDAGSSLITLLGFRLAGRRADAGHPYGHGRLEYVSGLAVAVVIILMAFELGKSAVEKILAPEPVGGGWLPAAILAAAIAVKLYMFCYNRAVAKRIGSVAMRAAAADSLSDCIATAVVLLSMGVSRLFAVSIDGWAGLAVALFILWTGIGAARDTLSPLLGQAPSPEFVREVTDAVLAHPEVLGIHDLIVHDYGPGRQIISLHAEVDGKKDVFVTHDAIDNIERELRARFGCVATIHMDPIETDNAAVDALRAQIAALAKELDPAVTIHDFRVVPGPSHTNAIFDAVIPRHLGLSDDEAAERLRALVAERIPGCCAVVTVDEDFT